MRKRRFGNIRASDCKILPVRLPDAVIKRLDEASNGRGAREWLTQIALSLGGNDDQSNQAKA